MQDKIEQIIKSKGFDLSKGYHYNLLYQVKPDIDNESSQSSLGSDDPVLALLLKQGMLSQAKIYQHGASESDFDVIRVYPVGQNVFELTREEWDQL